MPAEIPGAEYGERHLAETPANEQSCPSVESHEGEHSFKGRLTNADATRRHWNRVDNETNEGDGRNQQRRCSRQE